MVDHHSALIYLMVLVSASDADMSDDELETIGENVRYLPIFRDFDTSRLLQVTEECMALLSDADGLAKALETVRSALPQPLRETAYAVACDIAAADRKISREELRLLEMIRDHLEIDGLCAAAIERGARARHMTL